MSKHTPGPWSVHKTIGDTPSIESAHDAHFSVAIVPRSGPEMWANARLIAAAPEMLAALKLLVDNGGIGPEQMFRDARDAIAKAEGEKP